MRIPNSLPGFVLRCRYFQTGSSIRASLGTNASYFVGLELFRQRFRGMWEKSIIGFRVQVESLRDETVTSLRFAKGGWEEKSVNSGMLR